MKDEIYIELFNECKNDEERDIITDKYLQEKQKEEGNKYNTKSTNLYSWQTIQTQKKKAKRELLKMQLII